MNRRIALIGAFLLAGSLTACGSSEGRSIDDSTPPAIEATTTTTTEAPATTSTTAAPTSTVRIAAQVADRGDFPTDPYVLEVIDFYQTAPMGTDLTCRGLAVDRKVMADAFDPADAPFVVAAITERAMREGCPIS
jgi:hypothetical protein